MKQYVLVAVIASTMSLTACKSFDALKNKIREFNPLSDKITFVTPPKENIFKDIKKVELTISDGNSDLLQSTHSKLSLAKANGSLYFDSVYMSPNKEAKAVIKASLTSSNVSNGTHAEKRFKCPGDKAIRSCKSDEAIRWTVNCESKKGNVSGSIQVINKATGETLYTKIMQDEHYEKTCSDEKSSLPSDSEMLSQATRNLGRQLVFEMLPVTTSRPSDLLDDTSLFSEADSKLFESAIEKAHHDQLAAAKSSMELLLKKNKNNPVVLYDLGYIEHALGNFSKAKDYYQLAQANQIEPNQYLDKYLAETDEWLQKGIHSIR